jgi:hypothetical protein
MGLTIGVLTFHESINYGSYWQARCLVEGLRARGHAAALLDHRCPRIRSAELRSAFQPELPRRLDRRHHPALGAKVRAFRDAVAELPRSAPFPLDRPEEAPRHDAVVVGSDEVWNFSHPWFGGKQAFFGEGAWGARLVSYAASMGNHAGALDENWAARLRRFDAVSVRDNNAHAAVTAALRREPALVLDPCLQFPDVLPAAPATRGDYILLYGHGLPDWFARAARAAADARGLGLVSVGYPHPLADEERADAGPLAFAELVAGAAGVVTGFFHGAVFAIHYDRPFVAAASPYRRIKLEDLTASLNLPERMVDEETDGATLARLLETPPRAALAEGRARSAAFLDAALG